MIGPLSVPMVAALCAISAHDGLTRFRTGYGVVRGAALIATHGTVGALAKRGLVRLSPIARRASITWLGAERIACDGAPEGGRPTYIVAATQIAGGFFSVCEGSVFGPIVTLAPRTLAGFVYAAHTARVLNR